MIIPFIYASNCKDCVRMRNIINYHLKKRNLSSKVSLEEIDSEHEDAIGTAMKYHISDLPGCNINGISICGKNFTEKEIEEAIDGIESV